MRTLNLIAAVGNKGQLGLANGMPWEDADDLRWFRGMTMNAHIIMGGITYDAIADKLDGRTCHRWSRDIEPKALVSVINKMKHPLQEIWVAGGAKTYMAFMPFVRRSFITHIDYDGPADTFMPEIWDGH